MIKINKPEIFCPVLCLTHRCNLNCIYCYQKFKDDSTMSLETAYCSMDYIFSHIPKNVDSTRISFIGGEPLLEFRTIKSTVEYVESKYDLSKVEFLATTNGTVLTQEMKDWFFKRREKFYLCLSLDGNKETQNHNRSNSFDKIDLDFFTNTWSNASVKMTLSDFSLNHFSDDVKFFHSKGFIVNGANLCEGDFDWSKEEYIKELVPELKKLVDYYVENDDLRPCQALNLSIKNCEILKKQPKRTCGMGNETIFFETNGDIYPCSQVTPSALEKEHIDKIMSLDLKDINNFNDADCLENCYIYPICRGCYCTNYKINGSLNKHNHLRCRITKLMALFIADLDSKRILKNPDKFDDVTKFYTIEAIKKIRELYMNEFEIFFS